MALYACMPARVHSLDVFSLRSLAQEVKATLSDVDFAADIVLLHDSWDGIQAMTSSLEDEATKIGLMMNVAKTKILTVGN